MVQCRVQQGGIACDALLLRRHLAWWLAHRQSLDQREQEPVSVPQPVGHGAHRSHDARGRRRDWHQLAQEERAEAFHLRGADDHRRPVVRVGGALGDGPRRPEAARPLAADLPEARGHIALSELEHVCPGVRGRLAAGLAAVLHLASHAPRRPAELETSVRAGVRVGGDRLKYSRGRATGLRRGSAPLLPHIPDRRQGWR
mmetsp:Transcript_88092/g.254247  ORF Transcript_88092/g.254247 Transcript_88092/m.254247 type:complete len:200 (-) Transcript_88092:854-1453(-)